MVDYILIKDCLLIYFDGGGLGGALGELVAAVDFGEGALTNEIVILKDVGFGGP